MRKKLSMLLATTMVLTLMATGPVSAQVEPTITICLLVEASGPVGGVPIAPGTVEIAEDFAFFAEFLIMEGLATPGPCPEGGGQPGGGQPGGGQQGSGQQGSAQPGSGGGSAAAPLRLTQVVGGQEAESGDVEQSAEVSNSGDNVNQSVVVSNVANTGNVQNAQAVAQLFSEGDIDLEGSSIEVSPSIEFESEQSIEQAAAAG